MSQRYIGGLIYNPPGGFSGYFDGSGDRLEVASQTALGMGAGDFTYEAWVYVNETVPTNALRGLFDSRVGGATGCGIYTSADSGTTAKLVYTTNSAIAASSSSQIPSFIWAHIAVTRSSGTVRGFINGTLQFTVTDSRTFSSSAGTYIASDTTPAYFNGYISNARILKGTALYTADFTPPVGQLQAITNTSLLTCAYSTFRDGSSNNFTITVNGNTAVSVQNPFPLTALPNPNLGNQGNGVYTMSQYQSLRSQNLWPAIDPYWEYVTLMLHGNGTNGAQNNTFLDSSTNNFTITRNGNTTQGAFSPYGENWSNYFDGSGDYLSAASNAAFAPGTGDFTIECFVSLGSLTGNQGFFQNTNSTSSAITDKFWFGYSSSSSGLVLSAHNGGSGQASVSWAPSVGVWYHVAVVRQSGTIKMFINGVQQTVTGSTTFNGYSLGQAGVSVGLVTTPSYFTGYISNVRYVIGTAVYTANFTPPTAPLTAVANTSLLTCQSNRFIDNSTNNFTITRNGDVSVQRFSPFHPTAPYAAGTIGGSGYFDGSGDYLTLTDSSNVLDLGGAVASLEMWVYSPNVTSTASAFIKGGGANSYSTSDGIEYALLITGGTALFAYNTGGSSANITGAVIANAWNHIAIATNASNTISLFINGTRAATATNAITKPTTRTSIRIAESFAGGEAINGYISGLRMINGSGAYDASQTTITVPTAPPTAITNTQLLCSFTNGGIIDNAMMNDLETVGNAQISTSVSRFGGGSLAFDGTGDWLVLPSRPPLDFGTGDFTIEFWTYLNSTGIDQGFIGGTASGAYDIRWVTSNSTLRLGRLLVSFDSTFSWSPVVNTWYHVALTRSGSSIRAFVNGVQIGTTATNTNTYNTAGAMTIGVSYPPTPDCPMNGYIDDLRITKGYARYTANFTPQRSQWQDQ